MSDGAENVRFGTREQNSILIVLILRLETLTKTQTGTSVNWTRQHRRRIVLRTVPTIVLIRLHEFPTRTSKSCRPLRAASFDHRIKG